MRGDTGSAKSARHGGRYDQLSPTLEPLLSPTRQQGLRKNPCWRVGLRYENPCFRVGLSTEVGPPMATAGSTRAGLIASLGAVVQRALTVLGDFAIFAAS